MSVPTLGERLGRWAQAETSLDLLVLIGSHTRAAGDSAAADRFSDWDFQIATSRPEMFAENTWVSALGLEPIVYVERMGRLGSARKVTALFAEGELDLVVLPTAQLRQFAPLVKSGQHVSNPMLMAALIDLAAVLQGGFRVLKGADEFAALYEHVARTIPPPRLADEQVRKLADGFVCDYVSTLRKVDRGELLAAQRWLHHQLAETNFRLLHEFRQREGKPSFPDARRLELFDEAVVPAVTVAAAPEAMSLRRAADKAAATCRDLARKLLGGRWQWPEDLATPAP